MIIEYTYENQTLFCFATLARVLHNDVFIQIARVSKNDNIITLFFNTELSAQEKIDLNVAMNAITLDAVQWEKVRATRDQLVQGILWRQERYWRYNRLAKTQVDSMEELDNYIQTLADLPAAQTDPFNISWPEEP